MTFRAVLRYEKFKSLAKLGEAQKHITRARETPNADPDGTIKWIVEPKVEGKAATLSDAVSAQLDRLPAGKRKRRSDAVLCVGAVLSASPEFFGEEGKPVDEAKLKAWSEASVKWLQREHGANLIGVCLHLDEKTPHIHAYFLPIDKDRKLCAKRILTRTTLRKAQSTYAAAVNHLGIERGVEGSVAKHQSLKDFYKNIGLNIEAPTVGELASFKISGIMPDRLAVLIDKAKAGDLARKKLKETEATLAKVDGERKKLLEGLNSAAVLLQAEKAKTKQLAEQFRGLDIVEVAKALGAVQGANPEEYLIPGEPGAGGTKVRVHKKGFEIINIGGKPKNSRNAIDLIMAVSGQGFEISVRWLAAKFGVVGASNEFGKAMRDERADLFKNVGEADLKPIEARLARVRQLRESSTPKQVEAESTAAKIDVPTPVRTASIDRISTDFGKNNSVTTMLNIIRARATTISRAPPSKGR